MVTSREYEPRLTGTKTCTRCNVEQPVLAFPANRAHSDGLSSWCRECERQVETARRGSRRRWFIQVGWDFD